jgi:hypothetical protein
MQYKHYSSNEVSFGGSRCDNDDETKEGIPVYLDPANQTAVFNKRLPETVNQHIYDEVNATEETNKVLTRQTS